MALTYADATMARSLLPPHLQGHVQVDTQRNTVSVTAPLELRTTIVGQLRRIDVPVPPSNVGAPDHFEMRVVKLNHTTAATAMNLLPEGIVGFTRADETTNALSISAPPALVHGILNDIAAIDTPRAHIMLDARVVVLERNDLLDFGADFEWPQVQAGTVASDAVDFPYEVRIGYTPDRSFTNALTLTLNLMSRNDEATIIASPQVLAQDGVEAEIRVTTEEYVQITSENGAYIRSDLEQIETGTILRITPQVGRDAKITLDMVLEVSDVIARGEQNLPVVSRRIATSKVQLFNGGTAAVAGLIDSRTQTSRNGLPGASGLPLLGRAFRTDGLNHQARQVAIFVTANLVGQDGQEFKVGRQVPPSLGVVNEDAFRMELEAALDSLRVME